MCLAELSHAESKCHVRVDMPLTLQASRDNQESRVQTYQSSTTSHFAHLQCLKYTYNHSHLHVSLSRSPNVAVSNQSQRNRSFAPPDALTATSKFLHDCGVLIHLVRQIPQRTRNPRQSCPHAVSTTVIVDFCGWGEAGDLCTSLRGCSASLLRHAQ